MSAAKLFNKYGNAIGVGIRGVITIDDRIVGTIEDVSPITNNGTLAKAFKFGSPFMIAKEIVEYEVSFTIIANLMDVTRESLVKLSERLAVENIPASESDALSMYYTPNDNSDATKSIFRKLEEFNKDPYNATAIDPSFLPSFDVKIFSSNIENGVSVNSGILIKECIMNRVEFLMARTDFFKIRAGVTGSKIEYIGQNTA
jgi:hypothetical protein